VFARTPLIGNLRPGGKYTAKDVYDIGAPPSSFARWSKAVTSTVLA